MPAEQDIRTHAPVKRRTATDATPEAPNSLIRVVRVGGMLAVGFAAAISAQTLFRLGRLLDFPPETAWLLPAALDLCAGVCIWTAAVLPQGHRGRRRATIYATLALGFTVISNVLYHAISLGEWTWQDDSLMGVSALPPFVAEILLHLQMIVTGTHVGTQPNTAGAALPPAGARAHGTGKAAAPATGTEGGKDAPALPPAVPGIEAPPAVPAAAAGGSPTVAVGGSEDGTNVVALNGSDRRPPAAWAELALPLYRRHTTENGVPPTANVLVKMIRDAHPDLRVPASERSARNIRSATEALAADRGTGVRDDADDPERVPGVA